MELTETIEALNKRLKDYFGIDTASANPIYRIVFSDTEMELRETKYTKEGFELISPVVMELPKYKQWIHSKYILEKLVVVPSFHIDELAESKVSYEPLHVFQDKNGNYLPPKWDACKFIIDLIHAAQGQGSMARYLPAEHEKNDLVGQKLRADKLEEELFGNETPVGDALAYGYGVSMANTKKDNE